MRGLEAKGFKRRSNSMQCVGASSAQHREAHSAGSPPPQPGVEL